ncbi:MAG: response regulator transcription factor [Myxococcaceae bacterium]|nr:response regulator transcription factor [Myxococcaceae bacterium]
MSSSQSQCAPVRVLIVEDSPALLKNLAKSLSAHPERVELVGTALDGESGLAEAERLSPELLLLDLELPGIDGIEVTHRLKARHEAIDVLILTSFDDEKKVYEAIQAGASGYLVKRVRIERILDAIDEVRQGGIVLEPIIARRFWTYFDSVRRMPPAESQAATRAEPVEDFGLNKIEREVLLFIAKGLTNSEVGEAMQIDCRRVRWLLSCIYKKMGVHTHVDAVVRGIQTGLIEL